MPEDRGSTEEMNEDDTNTLPLHKDPLRYGWWIWFAVVLVLVGLPVSCTVMGAEKVEDRVAYCSKGWCFVRQEELATVLAGAKTLSGHVEELRKLCGWEK